MKTLFITGTGTGVGKTIASAWLCRELSEQGHKVAYVKPVQTGGIPCGEILLSVDLEYVKASAPKLAGTLCCMNFHIPASPHLVAVQENRPILLNHLVEKIEVFTQECQPDFLVVEGAGGIAVPLNDEDEMHDLCKALNADAIVVSSTALGTLNHSKLTINYLQQHGIDQISTILMRPEHELELIEQDNLLRLGQMAPNLACLPHYSGLDSEKGSLPEDFIASETHFEKMPWIT
jgi:dethiobiotin synthase